MNKLYSVFARYLIILLAGLFNLFIFYLVFTPLTIYPVYLILSLFGKTVLISNSILFNTSLIEFVKACIAGSAYYLLFILAMSVPEIKIAKRLNIILFLFGSLLLINIIRILVMVSLLPNLDVFNSVHLIIWFLLSLFVVAGLWFSAVKIFKIKKIPVYSDIKSLIKR